MLHDIEGEIKLADTLSNAGKEMKGYMGYIARGSIISGRSRYSKKRFQR